MFLIMIISMIIGLALSFFLARRYDIEKSIIQSTRTKIFSLSAFFNA